VVAAAAVVVAVVAVAAVAAAGNAGKRHSLGKQHQTRVDRFHGVGRRACCA
jgi:hypothetical protein